MAKDTPDTIEVPSLEHVLQTLAYQLSEFMTAKPSRSDAPYSERVRFGTGLGPYGAGCPSVLVEIVIDPTNPKYEDRWDMWAQVHIRPYPKIPIEREVNVADGSWTWHGNRCGGRDAYAKMCAPVIQWVANYWASPMKPKVEKCTCCVLGNLARPFELCPKHKR